MEAVAVPIVTVIVFKAMLKALLVDAPPDNDKKGEATSDYSWAGKRIKTAADKICNHKDKFGKIGLSSQKDIEEWADTVCISPHCMVQK
jgi:hypothetical protein